MDVWRAIRELADGGAALLLTTQYLEEADRLADTVTVLSGGRVVAEGSPAAIKDRVGGRRVEITVDDVAAAAEALAALDPAVDVRARLLSVAAPHGAEDLQAALALLADAAVAVEEAGLRRPTLDDAFFALTGHVEDPEEAIR
jgi:ABC-type multidrug transport system ATPase subunit